MNFTVGAAKKIVCANEPFVIALNDGEMEAAGCDSSIVFTALIT